jgi:hypothetical protein
MSQPDTTVVSLFNGVDPRYDELLTAIMNVIAERQKGLVFAGVLGVLRLVEDELILRQREP